MQGMQVAGQPAAPAGGGAFAMRSALARALACVQQHHCSLGGLVGAALPLLSPLPPLPRPYTHMPCPHPWRPPPPQHTHTRVTAARILRKSPQSREVGDDDVFSVNADFSSKTIRVRLMTISSQQERPEEKAETREQVRRAAQRAGGWTWWRALRGVCVRLARELQPCV